MRAALLHSKKTIDLQAKSNRESLLAGAAPVTDSRSVEDKATYVQISYLMLDSVSLILRAAAMMLS